MTERDFLINVRRIILSAVSLMDRRILELRTDAEKAEELETLARLDEVTQPEK